MLHVDLFCKSIFVSHLWSSFRFFLRIDQNVPCTNVECSYVVDKAGKGEGGIVDRRRGTNISRQGLQGSAPPCLLGTFAFLKASELNSHDLAQAFFPTLY